MAFKDSFEYGDGIAKTEEELAYDLRQIYANLVGEHLRDVASARKADNYSTYFKALKDLEIITQHNFKTRKGETETFERLMTVAMKLANEYNQVWIGESKDPKGCALIEEALNEIEKFLYEKINDSNMFGNKYRVPDL